MPEVLFIKLSPLEKLIYKIVRRQQLGEFYTWSGVALKQLHLFSYRTI